MLAYLSLGSNIGHRRTNLAEAVTQLEGHGQIVLKSSFYETEPVEMTGQPWFVNCVVALETQEPPDVLLSSILEIERKLGRVRQAEQPKGPRSIDIDILLFGDVVEDSSSLTIPHPAMHERRFVLEPLVEIASEAFHPVLKMTAQQMLSHLPFEPVVRKT